MCHSLGKLEEIYGDDFSDDRLLEGAEKVWRKIERWRKGWTDVETALKNT